MHDAGPSRVNDLGDTFTLAHPLYYESIDAYRPTPEFRGQIESLIPASWGVRRDGFWLHVHGGKRGAAQGFKIHVSSTVECSAKILDAVIPVCVEFDVPFKVAADTTLLALINSKRFFRGGAEKFVTIYPPTERDFERLMVSLYEATKASEFEGPYILSDRRFRDNQVLYYRYGGIAPRHRLRPDGTREPVIRGRNHEWVVDVRRPFFSLPEGVRDPFGGADELPGDGHTLLRGRYRVERPLSYSNSGGVYVASDLECNQRVVIKEARPHTGVSTIGGLRLDAPTLLRHERDILRRTNDIAATPTLIDFFQEWEHTFLVEEYIDAVSFGGYWASSENMIAPYIHDSARLSSSVPKLRGVGLHLIAAIEGMHTRGVALGDISPWNVLVSPTSLTVRLIDFEGAVMVDDDPRFIEFSTRWGTQGFVRPGRRQASGLSPCDDFYAAGALLAAAIAPVHALTRLKPTAISEFLDHFVQRGLPAFVATSIAHLQEGSVALAKQTLMDAAV
jgi:hypothetical protein